MRILDVEAQARRRLWRRVARALLSEQARRRLHMWFGDRSVSYRRDRAWLHRELLPAVGRRGGKVLFVGCRRYTRRYPAQLAAQGAECWTIDIDPTVARWGSPKRHVIGDILGASAHWPPASFDTVILNGVFGFGLDSVADQHEALRVCRLLLKEDGWLILGWNTDRSADPSELPILRDGFQPSSFLGLAQRKMFARSTHVYGIFRASSITSVLVSCFGFATASFPGLD